MMYPGFGAAELIVNIVMIIMALAFPLAVVYLLAKIHEKLKNIEERLKDK